MTEVAPGIVFREDPRNGVAAFATRSWAPGDVVLVEKPLSSALVFDMHNAADVYSMRQAALETHSQQTRASHHVHPAAWGLTVQFYMLILHGTWFTSWT